MYQDLAKRIPDRVRSERLMIKADPIQNAIPHKSNSHMQLLFAIYTEFLYPHKDEDINCPRCLQRIQHCFVTIKPYLIELEKQYKLLNALK